MFFWFSFRFSGPFHLFYIALHLFSPPFGWLSCVSSCRKDIGVSGMLSPIKIDIKSLTKFSGIMTSHKRSCGFSPLPYTVPFFLSGSPKRTPNRGIRRSSCRVRPLASETFIRPVYKLYTRQKSGACGIRMFRSAARIKEKKNKARGSSLLNYSRLGRAKFVL